MEPVERVHLRNELATPAEVQAAGPAGYEFYLRGRGYLLNYHKPENIDAAIKQFQQTLTVNPNYALALAGLGQAYWRGFTLHMGKDWLNLASASCEKALLADPELAQAHTCLGHVYNETGDYKRSADEFNHALGRGVRDTEACNELGKAYSKVGRTAEAEEIYKRAITISPQYWAVYNWLGLFYLNQGRYADAASMFRKVSDLRPDFSRGFYNLGAILLLEGNYSEAAKSLNRSIELSPTLSAYSNLGAAYFWQYDYTGAIWAYDKARSLDDQDYLNWGNLADALYWSSNRRFEAAPAYRRAIELALAQVRLNPRDAMARAYIAQYSSMLGDTETATREAQKASQLAPEDSEVLFRQALVWNQLGDEKRTLESLKKAVRANYSRTVIRDTPDFSHLRGNPEFQSLIASK